jgi:hypothetical protein
VNFIFIVITFKKDWSWRRKPNNIASPLRM